MSSEGGSIETVKKISPMVHSDMVVRAMARGCLEGMRLTPSTTPGRYRVAFLVSNRSLGGPDRYVEWESYTSMEKAARQDRLGLLRQTPNLLGVDDAGIVSLKPGTVVSQEQRVQYTMQIADMVRMRAVAYEIIALVDMKTYVTYNERLLVNFRRQLAEGFRGPTVNELRLVDRSIHGEILRQVSSGHATLEEGISWFAGEGERHALWSLGEQVPEATPDRRIERRVKVAQPSGSALTSQASGKHGAPEAPAMVVDDDAGDLTICNVCGLTRAKRPKRRFCPKPEPKEEEKKKQGKAGGGKGKGKGGKGRGHRGKRDWWSQSAWGDSKKVWKDDK
jgi:hypothetical protein